MRWSIHETHMLCLDMMKLLLKGKLMLARLMLIRMP